MAFENKKKKVGWFEHAMTANTTTLETQSCWVMLRRVDHERRSTRQRLYDENDGQD